MKNENLGIMYMSLAYILWGILPIYWKMLEHVSSEEILAHRIIWSFIFMIFFITFQNKLNKLLKELITILHKPKVLLSLFFSSFFISVNWFVYIWAVNHERVLEASLGYYINPIVSVFLGMIFLREKMNRGQQLAFVLAAIGVLISTIHYGQIPFVSLILAVTFGLYGLTKKLTKL